MCVVGRTIIKPCWMSSYKTTRILLKADVGVPTCCSSCTDDLCQLFPLRLRSHETGDKQHKERMDLTYMAASPLDHKDVRMNPNRLPSREEESGLDVRRLSDLWRSHRRRSDEI